MQLTKHTDYAFRLLMFIALNRRDELIQISSIVEQFKVPKNHLVKVVHQLGILGYIQTVRGRGGGIRLSRPASEIKLGDVVNKMETSMDFINCASPLCVIASVCSLKPIINQARNEFVHVLNQYSIEDLTHQGKSLSDLILQSQGQLKNEKIVDDWADIDFEEAEIFDPTTPILTNKTIARLINIAGRQRMLSQKMLKELFAILLGVNSDKNKKNIQGTAELFQESLRSLRFGNKDWHIQAVENGEIKKQLILIDTIYQDFYDNLEHIVTHFRKDEINPTLSSIYERNLYLLNEVDKLVKLYEALID